LVIYREKGLKGPEVRFNVKPSSGYHDHTVSSWMVLPVTFVLVLVVFCDKILIET
jgi:hypothetical protein